MAYNDSSYGLFQGQLFAAKRTMNGAQIGGYVALGDADKFEISPKQKFEDIEESQTGLGLTAAHIPTSTQITVKINLLNIKTSNWEKAVWGISSGAVAEGTVSGEDVIAYPGASIPLSHPGVSSVVLSAGTLDVDYTVDLANGMIHIAADSAVFADEDGTAATVSYGYGAYTNNIQAFTEQQPIFMLRLNAKNTANSGQPILVNVFQWAPDMAKVLDLIGKKHISFELDGMLIQDTLRALPSAENPFSQFFEILKA